MKHPAAQTPALQTEPLAHEVPSGWEVVQAVVLVAGTHAWQAFSGLNALVA
jgi:hypothetical protein